MIIKNDLIRYEGDGKIVRVLWIRSDGEFLAQIDVHASRALPEIRKKTEVIDDLNAKRASLVLEDVFATRAGEANFSEPYVRRRDNAWKIIRSIVSDEPGIFIKDTRGRLVSAVMAQYGVTHITVYRYLRRYWQRGQTPNALLPDYANSGGRGKERKVSAVKLGRPRLYGEQEGINVTPEIRNVMRVAVSRYYAGSEKFTLKGAYDEMIRIFFVERRRSIDWDGVIHAPKEAFVNAGFPTYTQFEYWFKKDQDALKVKRSRVGSRAYDKGMRALMSTSAVETWGPGARYQIDATVADVYLVSCFDRSRIIGRPVLYIVIDVFSRMVVGLYVGLEGPSWVGAMMALANTVSDKVDFCKGFGRDIGPDDWPCRHLPSTLLGDRGEIESRYIDELANCFNVNIETAAPYRADWKGVVEQRFRLLPKKFRPYVAGYVAPDSRERGGRDYRLDATLDLKQFTRIIIDCVLHHNNFHEIKDYDRSRGLVADNVPSVPVEMWNWGVANCSGKLRAFPERQVRFRLLPRDEASVTEFGIRFKGCFYSSGAVLARGWFDKARQRRRWKVAISYDPRSMDEILLHDPDADDGFIVCQLTDRSRARQGVSLWESEQAESLASNLTARRKQTVQLAGADLADRIEETCREAESMKVPAADSDRQRTRGIKKSRQEEKKMNRADEAFHFAASGGERGRVIPLRPGNDYSDPDIDEILGGSLGE